MPQYYRERPKKTERAFSPIGFAMNDKSYNSLPNMATSGGQFSYLLDMGAIGMTIIRNDTFARMLLQIAL